MGAISWCSASLAPSSASVQRPFRNGFVRHPHANAAGSGGLELGVLLARELRHLGPTFESGVLEERRHLGIGHEVLIGLLIAVQEHPQSLAVTGIAKYIRTPGPVLLSLLSALGRERVPEALEILDLHRGQDHGVRPPLDVVDRLVPP